MVLPVENSHSSFDVTLLGEVTRFSGSFLLLVSSLGMEASLSSSFFEGGLVLEGHEGVCNIVLHKVVVAR